MVTCLGDLFFPEVGEADRRGAPPARRARWTSRRARRAAGCRSSTPATTTTRRGWPPGPCGCSSAPSTWWCRRAPARGWSRHEYPGLLNGRARPARGRRGAGRAHAASCPSSSSRCSASPGWSRTVAGPRHLPRLLPPPARARRVARARGRCCASSPASSSSSCRARTSAAASAARSPCACPRSPPPSSTRSWRRSRRRGPTASSPATRGCLMQMRGGLDRRGSRVRALHLAEVLDGRTPVSRARASATPFPPAGRRTR